ncbi:MAG TPA: RNA polymerase sigma factor [Solirubrobacteraceae bacterium]|nr:RNA polymerase sigma factor [Solirubrobacteraceae bacterium]
MTSFEDDAAAFRDIFERHHVEIRRYLRHRVADPAVAEDLAAETFARAFAGRHGFADRGHGVRPWLFQIATNLLRDELRARARRRTLTDRLRGERPPAVHLAAGADPELAAALATLRRDELDVLLLFAWADLSYEEIAAALHVPVGTVRSRLSRARGRLRAQLDPAPSPVPSAQPERSPS